jgi:hypothetical protein
MNTPVGPTDLQQLLSTLEPARRPRALVPERSKVIRLGPEAQALGAAIAAPRTPSPADAPGMTPAAPRPPGGITNLIDDDDDDVITEARARRPAGAEPPGLATPPPLEPLPPIQPWRSSPNGPLPLARADRATPPRPVASAAVAPARLHSAASAAPVVASWAGGAAVAAAAAPLALEGRPSTAEHLPTVAPVAPPASRRRRETARVLLRPGATWRPLGLAFAAALLLVAGLVHLAVVPLDVLLVWRKPASLAIATDPAGAAVTLDGTSLGSPAPTTTTVRRDRDAHVLEASAPGYRPVRQTVRYDRSVSLSFTLRLEKAAPTLEPVATPKAAAAPAPAPAAASPAIEPKPRSSAKATKPTARSTKAAARKHAAKHR